MVHTVPNSCNTSCLDILNNITTALYTLETRGISIVKLYTPLYINVPTFPNGMTSTPGIHRYVSTWRCPSNSSLLMVHSRQVLSHISSCLRSIYSDVTWALRRLTWPMTRLLVEQLAQTNNKKHLKIVIDCYSRNKYYPLKAMRKSPKINHSCMLRELEKIIILNKVTVTI